GRVDRECLIEQRLRRLRLLDRLERLLVDGHHQLALDRDVARAQLLRGLEALARLLELVLVEERLAGDREHGGALLDGCLRQLCAGEQAIGQRGGLHVLARIEVGIAELDGELEVARVRRQRGGQLVDRERQVRVRTARRRRQAAIRLAEADREQ